MAIEPAIVLPEVMPRIAPRLQARNKILSDYWTLTKPDVNFLIAITVFAGFCLGRPSAFRDFPFVRLFHTLLGTSLVSSGCGVLNQFIERGFDTLMRRTARRPLAAGRITPFNALWFGILLSTSGAIYLAFAVNLLASLLAVLTLTIYLAVYTPLKRKTALCTLIGAFPGAVPPLIGWAAASGRLSSGAWILYAMLFLWQFPHFMSIAWMYRDDYDRAGYLILPGGKERNRVMVWQSVLPALALIPVCWMPTITVRAGLLYAAAASLLSFVFLCGCVHLALRRSNAAARRLLHASIIYLPSVLLLMLLDKK